MDWGRVQFFLSEVRRSFTRNPVMQITAIGTVTVTILMLGAFLFGRQTLTTIGDQIVRKIEISVFLDDNVDPVTARKLEVQIAADPRVLSVTYISRAEGLALMRERLRGQIDMSLLKSNPLPDALRVRVVDPALVTQVAAHIQKMPGVATTVYAQDVVTKMLRMGDILSRLGLIVVISLVLTAAIIISNTIRLTVFARRREIGIMQLVGASAAYIRGPFICEGLIHGVVGALIAIGLLAAAQAEYLPKLQAALPFIPLSIAGHDELVFSLALLGTGACVGILSSWISVDHYLRT
ncbi:MAG TPA: permease-like cell division protein FtsX [Candidatus Acidoferrales bacterium]|nr:permease-like cell division protein FtsX [Candidatus Acidoferrales bacterium]